jgi:hypothetical protein
MDGGNSVDGWRTYSNWASGSLNVRKALPFFTLFSTFHLHVHLLGRTRITFIKRLWGFRHPSTDFRPSSTFFLPPPHKSAFSKCRLKTAEWDTSGIACTLISAGVQRDIKFLQNIYVLYIKILHIHIPILSLYATHSKRYLATEGGNNMDAGWCKITAKLQQRTWTTQTHIHIYLSNNQRRTTNTQLKTTLYTITSTNITTTVHNITTTNIHTSTSDTQMFP